MNITGRFMLHGLWMLIGIILVAYDWRVGSGWILGGFTRPLPKAEELRFVEGVTKEMRKRK